MPTLGIIVGGGPAPGINGIIAAAVIEARKVNWKAIGFMDGFKWLAKGQVKDDKFREFQIRDVSRIHMRGGSVLRISREGNLKNPEEMANTLNILDRMGITHLMVIGGEGTAYSSLLLSRATKGKINVVHVPKTIDNDLPLPGTVPTFGFETARHMGVQIVEAMMDDSYTVGRWYFIVVMGRKTGHLSLGIGKSSGATLTLVPEEFGNRKVSLSEIADILETSILKRMTMGQDHGVALLAEGLLSILTPEDMEKIGQAEKDPSGHIRFSELNLGDLLKEEVQKRLRSRGIPTTIASKNLGYELRCARPIPMDQEYTRALGFGAMKFLQANETGVLVIFYEQKIERLVLEDLLEPDGTKLRIRKVDVGTGSYRVAREYMIRLEKRDIEDPQFLQKLVENSRMSQEEFLKKFSYLIQKRQ